MISELTAGHDTVQKVRNAASAFHVRLQLINQGEVADRLTPSQGITKQPAGKRFVKLRLLAEQVFLQSVRAGNLGFVT